MWRLAQRAGAGAPAACLPLRQPMAVLFDLGRWCGDFRRTKASQPLSLRALTPDSLPRSWRLHDQCAPAGTIVAGMSPENTARIRVLTIVITAPQQVHRTGARSLNQVLV